MLSKRYKNDGVSHMKLNDIQWRMRRSIEDKIERGIYRFETVSCAVCDSKDYELLGEKDRHGLYMPVVICRRCGLIYTNPRMTQESYDLFYNDEYAHLDRIFFENNLQLFFDGQRKRGESIWRYLSGHGLIKKDPKDIKVLEVGCGAGGILQYFKDKGCSVKGIDLGREYLEYGKSRGVSLDEGTLFTANLPDKYDIFICSHVIEHLLRPNNELQKLCQLAAPGAIMYVALPGARNLKEGRTLLNILRNAHVTHFTLRTLKNLLGKNGWKFIAGDEKIKSIFMLAPGDFQYLIENDFEEEMKYLKEVERMRVFNVLYHQNIKNPLKNFLYQLCLRVQTQKEHREE